MTLQNLFQQKKITKSLEDSKKLIFDRQVKVNGQFVANIYSNIKIGDIIKIGKIEILIVRENHEKICSAKTR